MTLEDYAQAKGLPVGFLQRLGLRTQRYMEGTALRIPYLDEGGEEVAVRFRLCLRKEDGIRFKWKTGSTVMPYGLSRLSLAQAMESVVVVEGESDTQTLWYKGIPALGIPGAQSWKPEWADCFRGVHTIFVVRDQDAAGTKLVQSLLRTPAIRDRLRVVDLPEKDTSELYLRDPEGFEAAFAAALDQSVVATEEERLQAEQSRQTASAEAFSRCESLARHPAILERVAETLRSLGLVGTCQLAKLVYLATTSRLLAKPVSLVAKGPSAAGKSFETETTLKLFPESAFYALTAMSEHALAYSEEPLSHRMIVFYEAAGVDGDFASYLFRSLLSEGCVKYETVEKTREGMRARLIVRPGPTGGILTTTAISLHPENETRLLSVPVDDSQAQTRAVLSALAEDTWDAGVDLEVWHALQDWLESQPERRVAIPFAQTLASEIPPVAVRLRRDFGMVLNLIRTHALLHQASRERDDEGRIVATLDDYATVYELVREPLGDASAATVSPQMRETVEAVAKEIAAGTPEVSVARLAELLGLDKSSASRRWSAARSKGWLANREDKRGKPARIVLGDPLPDGELLPRPEVLQGLTGPLQGPVQHSSPRNEKGNGGVLQSCTPNRGDADAPPSPEDFFEPTEPLL